MDEVAAFALGVLVGLVIYWLVYRLYWMRWRAHTERDLSYLRAKVDSAEFTSFGLERQLTTQKTELTAQRAKIALLERENRQAQSRLEEVSADRQALLMHLETLRAELAAYKKVMMEPALPALSLPPQSNRKTHPPQKDPHPERQNTTGLPNSLLEMNKEPPEEAPTKISPILPAVPLAKTPYNGNGNGYGNGHFHSAHLPEQILEPVLIIARPRPGGDRLEIIQGIGPAIVKKLNKAGIDTFLALSMLTPERLKEIIGPRAAKLIDAQGVINQAKKLVGERRPRNGTA